LRRVTSPPIIALHLGGGGSHGRIRQRCQRESGWSRDITDALAAFAAQAVKVPAGPAPDANAAVAYALGWTVGEALTWATFGNTAHLEEAPPDRVTTPRGGSS
jgi:hypothetical protein